MTAFLNWRFWIGMVVTSIALSASGLAIAHWLIQPPPRYFRGANLEFALPRGWISDRIGNEIICSPPDPPPNNAMIILAAKQRSTHDNLAEYEKHLARPRPITRPDGTPAMSEVVYVLRSHIGGYEWIDAVHRNSEINGHDTRYLATVTSHMGTAVTFTARRDFFEERNREFEESIESLKIHQSPSPFN